MSFTFTPQSEEEVMNLLKEGVYEFAIKSASEKLSKAGNTMIHLVLGITADNGYEHLISDYLLSNMLYKVKHFCESVGLEDKYAAGELSPSDCMNKKGHAKIKIQPAGEYAARNVVKDYVKLSQENSLQLNVAPTPTQEFGDSEIPF